MSVSKSLTTLPSSAVEDYRCDGFYIHRGLFDRREAAAAATWLKVQDHTALGKSWTEQEPGFPLAVFTTVHTGDHPVARLAADPRMLDLASFRRRIPSFGA
jgi:hypothetical protein